MRTVAQSYEVNLLLMVLMSCFLATCNSGSSGSPTDPNAFIPACFGDGDTDGDGLCNSVDNCPNIGNLDQADGDQDGAGNACDLCPATRRDEAANADGCSARQLGEDCDSQTGANCSDEQLDLLVEDCLLMYDNPFPKCAEISYDPDEDQIEVTGVPPLTEGNLRIGVNPEEPRLCALNLVLIDEYVQMIVLDQVDDLALCR